MSFSACVSLGRPTLRHDPTFACLPLASSIAVRTDHTLNVVKSRTRPRFENDLRRRQVYRCFQLRMATHYYASDEVSALVLDIGTATTRLGYAGEDVPRCVMPTSYGYIPKTITTVNEEGVEAEAQSRDSYVGENGVNRWRPGMEVANPMADGLSTSAIGYCIYVTELLSSPVYDFSAVKDIVSHGFSKGLEVNPEEHPILLTEPAWNTPANRERMAEIMFEEFNVPAFYISNNAVLSTYATLSLSTGSRIDHVFTSFSSGRGTALLVDIGKATASVTPVVDGFVLRKGT